NQLLYCWHIADELGKGTIKQKSIEYLSCSFDADHYEEAVFLDIFSADEHIEFLEQLMSYAYEISSPFDIKFETTQWIIQNYRTYNCLNCLAFMNVDFNNDTIQKIAQKSEYYNWLINYGTFDYSKFHTQWLFKCPYHILIKLHTVKPLKKKVAKELN